MLGKTYDSQVCSMARALELVGERWSLLILRDAVFAKVTRFGDFRHNLGIATNVLAARLDSFVAAGIMQADDGEYLLTEKGRDLAPAMVALTEWGDRWAAPGERPIIYSHRDCGGELRVETRCETHGTVPADEIGVRPGPGMPADYLANRRPRRATPRQVNA